jgi:hypothetical protein
MVGGDHQHDGVVGSLNRCDCERDRRPRIATDRLSKDVISRNLWRALAYELHLARRHHDVGVVDGDEWREALKGYREWAASMQERQERLRPIRAT